MWAPPPLGGTAAGDAEEPSALRHGDGGEEGTRAGVRVEGFSTLRLDRSGCRLSTICNAAGLGHGSVTFVARESRTMRLA